MLEQCIDLFEQLERNDLSALLRHAVEGEPLATPADHKGPAATQVLRVELDVRVRAEMLSAIADAHQRGLTTPHTVKRGLGGFVEAWQEYAAYEADH